jgi:hypothetical protein
VRPRGQNQRIKPLRLRVLGLTHTEGEHDVRDALNDRERGHPGDEQDCAAPVVAGCPEPKRELDDPANQLKPPDLDLVPSRNRGDDGLRAPALKVSLPLISPSRTRGAPASLNGLRPKAPPACSTLMRLAAQPSTPQGRCAAVAFCGKCDAWAPGRQQLISVKRTSGMAYLSVRQTCTAAGLEPSKRPNSQFRERSTRSTPASRGRTSSSSSMT